MSSSSALELRRAGLAALANPGGQLDYLVSLAAAVGTANVTLRYVPDRLVLAPGAFERYAAELPKAIPGDWPSPEALAIAILHDINNEIVPRWLQVTVACGVVAATHAVAVVDQQPNWKNPGLLARVGAL
ncbi:MAG: hypothetical protein FJX35_12375 [Alphaproteobacteria bacterium]|nr:hypothetical protein [Alphaproteobacteria bacterium]